MTGFIALIINISYHLPDRKYFSANILAQIFVFLEVKSFNQKYSDKMSLRSVVSSNQLF